MHITQADRVGGSTTWTSIVVVVLITLIAGCRAEAGTVSPTKIDALEPIASADPLPRLVIEGFTSGRIGLLRGKMSPELRGRLPAVTLTAAAHRLRDAFGRPLGIVEQRLHDEDGLRWYSALVLFGKETQPARVMPILVQFAATPQGQLERLIVREHWWLPALQPPATEYLPVNRFHLPADGRWTVVHGGRRKRQNYHHDHRAQRYAWDLVVKKNGRQRPANTKKRNEAYYAYGRDILAPAPGTVVVAINDIPENVPGEMGSAGGNGVVIDHGFGEYSALWHAIPGSVRVQVGDPVRVGQVLAKVGNSGRSSGPHIHFHVSYRTGAGAGQEKFALPIELVDVTVNGRWHPRRMPRRGQTVETARKRDRRVALAPMSFVDG